MSGMRLDPATPPPATRLDPAPQPGWPLDPATPPPELPPGMASAASPPTTFTREELDAAEPERHPSASRRWLLGFGIGALAFALLSFEGVPLVPLMCLPFALTPAGAGALVGCGLAWLVLVGWSVVLWLNGDLAVAPTIAAWMIAGFIALVTGLAGSAVVARRVRVRRG